MYSATGDQFFITKNTVKGELRATITQVGASLREFTIRGIELVEPYGVDQFPPHCAGVIMAPWPNRVDNGKWTYKGETLQLSINLVSQQNANHGLLMEFPYSVLEKTESKVTLGATIYPRSGYPFHVVTTVTYELTEQGLLVTQTAINRSEEDAPYATGGHPYLKIGTHNGDDLVLRSNAQTLTQVDERQIPIGRMDTQNTAFDMSQGVRLADVEYDHNFTDIPREQDGFIHTYLSSPDGAEFLDVWQDQNYENLVLFTPDFFPTIEGKKVNCVAIEPGTAPPNAFNSGEDLIWLKNSQVFEGTWGINVHV